MATKQQPRHRSPEIERAHTMLRQPVVDGQAVLDLVKLLKAQRAFGTARKLLDYALKNPAQSLASPIKIKLAQKLALCTYKDPDLPPATAHRFALYPVHHQMRQVHSMILVQ